MRKLHRRAFGKNFLNYRDRWDREEGRAGDDWRRRMRAQGRDREFLPNDIMEYDAARVYRWWRSICHLYPNVRRAPAVRGKYVPPPEPEEGGQEVSSSE